MCPPVDTVTAELPNEAQRTIEAAREFRDRLFALKFKNLRRPIYQPKNGRGEKEVRWALRVYACPSISLFRDHLNGFLVAYENKLCSPCFVILRAMLETLAMANYVCQLAEPHIQSERWDRAWNEVLERASLGSYYMMEHSSVPKDPQDVLPLNVGKAIDSLQSLVSESMKQEYSYLSELSHPNGLALMPYVDMEAEGALFHFTPEFRAGELAHALGVVVSMAALAYLRTFRLAKMKSVERHIGRAVKSFVDGQVVQDA